MLLGGLWHGAGWNFLIWGGLHGLFLVMNQAWLSVKTVRQTSPVANTVIAWLVTFVAVVFTWVPFRATSYEGTINMWQGMLGWNGAYFPDSLHDRFNLLGHIELWVVGTISFNGLLPDPVNVWWLGLLVLVVVALPNTQQLLQNYHPVLLLKKGANQLFRFNRVFWKPNIAYAIGAALLFFFTLTSMSGVSEFLYFNF